MMSWISFAVRKQVKYQTLGETLIDIMLCKHFTKPTHKSHSRTRDFSSVSQDLSHRVNRNLCVQQNRRSHIKHRMSHAPSRLFPSHLSTTLPSDHQLDLGCCPLHTEKKPARIHRMCLSAPLAESHSPTCLCSSDDDVCKEAEVTSPRCNRNRCNAHDWRSK